MVISDAVATPAVSSRRRRLAFDETLERSPDVVLGRTVFVALYDEAERFLLSLGGHVHSLYLV